MKNKYLLHPKISEAKSRQLVRCFSLDLHARQTAAITGLNHNATNRFFIPSGKELLNVVGWSPRFSAKARVMNPISAADGPGAGETGAQPARRLSLASFRETERATPKLSRPGQKPLCKPSSGEKSIATASSTPMAGEVTRPGRSRVQEALPGPPWEKRVRPRQAPHQRHRVLLVFFQEALAAIPWCACPNLLPAPQGVRVQVQLLRGRHFSHHPENDPGASSQLVQAQKISNAHYK